MDANFAHTYLEEAEENSVENVKNYILVDDERFATLSGFIFKAKTNEGAVMALFNYMHDKKIVMPSGVNKGFLIQDADDILNVVFDEMDESEEELKNVVDEFIDESMVVVDKITIIDNYNPIMVV